MAAALLGRKYIGIDINSEAIDLCHKRLEQPFKTDSRLLEKGIDAYKTKTKEETAILSQFNCITVQRNKGIDAILKKHYLDKPVAIKIQRSDETFQEAVTLLYNAGKRKKCSFTILITYETNWKNTDCFIPVNMYVFNRYDSQFEIEMEELNNRMKNNII